MGEPIIVSEHSGLDYLSENKAKCHYATIISSQTLKKGDKYEGAIDDNDVWSLNGFKIKKVNTKITGGFDVLPVTWKFGTAKVRILKGLTVASERQNDWILMFTAERPTDAERRFLNRKRGELVKARFAVGAENIENPVRSMKLKDAKSLAGDKLSSDDQKHAAATTIGSAFRGHLARQRGAQLANERQEKHRTIREHEAATRIQALQRGRVVRGTGFGRSAPRHCMLTGPPRH